MRKPLSPTESAYPLSHKALWRAFNDPGTPPAGQGSNTFNMNSLPPSETSGMVTGSTNAPSIVNIPISALPNGTTLNVLGIPGDTVNLDAQNGFLNVVAGTTNTANISPAGGTGVLAATVGTVNVLNFPFTAPTTGNAVAFTATTGASTTTQVGTFTLPNGAIPTPVAAGNYSASINWGDGSATSTGLITQDGTNPNLFHVQGTHTFTTTTAANTPDPVVATITVTPQNFVANTVNFILNGPSGGTALATGSATVVTNQPPVLTKPANVVTTTGQAVQFTVSATDPDAGQTLTYSLGAGAPSGASIDPNTGIFGWTPASNQGNQTYTITITVTDNGTPNLSNSQTFNVTVGQGNRPPVVTQPTPQTITAGNLLTFTVSATNPDAGQTLTYSLTNPPAGATINPTTGAFTWTPATSQEGTANITVVATDNGTPNLSGSATFTVTVNAPNHPPVITPPTPKTVTVGTQLTVNIVATDQDQGQTLTYSLGNGAPAGAAINANSGQFTWTPTAAQVSGAAYSIPVTVTDNGTPPLSDTVQLSVTVNAVNHAPVVTQPGPQTVIAGNLLTVNIVATDQDQGQTLTYSLSNPPAGATINPNTGAFSWTPATSQEGTANITVVVTDNGTPPLSDSKTFLVTVNAPNHPPVITQPGVQTVVAGTPLTVPMSASDQDPGQTLTYYLYQPLAGASINHQTGTVSYTPSLSLAGQVIAIGGVVIDNGTPAKDAFASFAVIITAPAPPPPPFVSGATSNRGKKGLTSITLTFNEAMSGAAANPGFYTLTVPNPKSSKKKPKPPVNVAFNVSFNGLNTVVLTLSKAQKSHATLTINAALTAANGSALGNNVQEIF